MALCTELTLEEAQTSRKNMNDCMLKFPRAVEVKRPGPTDRSLPCCL